MESIQKAGLKAVSMTSRKMYHHCVEMRLELQSFLDVRSEAIPYKREISKQLRRGCRYFNSQKISRMWY